MDKIDKTILKILQADSRTPISKISKKINLSRPSVNERILRLMNSGVIEKFNIKVSPQKIGYAVLFYVLISDITIPNDKFKKMLLENESIIDIQCVTGRANYVIKVGSPSIELMNELLAELRQYSQIETMIILHTLADDRDIPPIF